MTLPDESENTLSCYLFTMLRLGCVIWINKYAYFFETYKHFYTQMTIILLYSHYLSTYGRQVLFQVMWVLFPWVLTLIDIEVPYARFLLCIAYIVFNVSFTLRLYWTRPLRKLILKSHLEENIKLPLKLLSL